VSKSETIDAFVSFFHHEEGGRAQPARSDGSYRPHIVVGDPCQRQPKYDEAKVGTEEYLGVSICGDARLREPGEAHRVTLKLVYAPDIDYSALGPGATFTIREGGNIVGFGSVAPAIYADFNRGKRAG